MADLGNPNAHDVPGGIQSGAVQSDLEQAAQRLLRDIADILAEDAQTFAAPLECGSEAMSPADAVKLFANKLRATARDFRPLSDLQIFN